MRRWSLLLLILLISLVSVPAGVYAGVVWCKSDPIVSLNGTLVDITAEIPLEYMPFVNGPVRYTIATPPQVNRVLILNDLGYNGHGSTVRFVDRGGSVIHDQFPITISVYVPIDQSRLPPNTQVPVRLSVLPVNGPLHVVEGTAQKTITATRINGLCHVYMGVEWCKSEPIISLNGTLVDITVEIPLEYMPFVNGPVRYTIATPPQVLRLVIATDHGYNGHGSTVRFVDRSGSVSNGQFPTTISVYVPIDQSRLPPNTQVPVRLSVLPVNGPLHVVEGTAQKTITVVNIRGL